jgi:SAM-dependent methyltransferase
VAADFRCLPFATGAALAVIACDNALPHLLSLSEIRTALEEFKRCLRPGGAVVLSMRDYHDPPRAGTVEHRPYAPGLRSSAETLFRRTSKLPATELIAPARVIGGRTEDCIRSGVIFGGAEAVDGIVRRMKAEWEWPSERAPLVVATGGLAPLIQPHCREVERLEPHLTFVGLQIAYDIVKRLA